MSQNTQDNDEPYIVKFGTVSVDEKGVLVLADFKICKGDSKESDEVVILTLVLEGLEQVLDGYNAKYNSEDGGKKWLN